MAAQALLSFVLGRPRFAHPVFIQDVQAALLRLILWMGHAGTRLHGEEAIRVAANGVNTYLELLL